MWKLVQTLWNEVQFKDKLNPTPNLLGNCIALCGWDWSSQMSSAHSSQNTSHVCLCVWLVAVQQHVERRIVTNTWQWVTPWGRYSRAYKDEIVLTLLWFCECEGTGEATRYGCWEQICRREGRSHKTVMECTLETCVPYTRSGNIYAAR